MHIKIWFTFAFLNIKKLVEKQINYPLRLSKRLESSFAFLWNPKK